jgi:hypothetical protein
MESRHLRPIIAESLTIVIITGMERESFIHTFAFFVLNFVDLFAFLVVLFERIYKPIVEMYITVTRVPIHSPSRLAALPP